MPQAAVIDTETTTDPASDLDLTIEIIDAAAEVGVIAASGYCSCECW